MVIFELHVVVVESYFFVEQMFELFTFPAKYSGDVTAHARAGHAAHQLPTCCHCRETEATVRDGWQPKVLLRHHHRREGRREDCHGDQGGRGAQDGRSVHARTHQKREMSEGWLYVIAR